MAKRLNITISDELHENLQVFKNKINISKICQKAIESAIELEKIKRQYWGFGYSDAQEYGGILKYPDFKLILEGDEETKQQYYDEYLFFYVIEFSNRNPLVDALIPPDEGEPQNGVTMIDDEMAYYEPDETDIIKYNSYMDGFEKGVKDYWEKNKDKIIKIKQ